jgi:hypothetical protein
VRTSTLAVAAGALLTSFSLGAEQPRFDQKAAGKYARLALDCIHREYPNKPGAVYNGDSEVRLPREMTPAFYGCFDWHSCVHGHWLLVRLLRTFPSAPFADEARRALAEDFSPLKIATEAETLVRPGMESFERPYGLAWLLQLCAELREWDDPQAKEWEAALAPLEKAAAGRLSAWLPRLSRPVRIGEHDQTAFGLGLVLDWAGAARDSAMETLVRSRAEDYFGHDRSCPLAYEPGGEDFLSPCLGEADLMRRVKDPKHFADWLRAFLPEIPRDGSAGWLSPAVVTDPEDPKLAHLDGLNLSRAWMLEGIAAGLPKGDRRRSSLMAAARAHRDVGLARVTAEHYAGSHWLGTFAVYLATESGFNQALTEPPPGASAGRGR